VNGSAEELERALSTVFPQLVGCRVVLNGRLITSNPRYFQGTAVLDDAYLVKFAWSERAARRIDHEARVLKALANAELGLPVVACGGHLEERPGAADYQACARSTIELGSGQPGGWKASSKAGPGPGPIPGGVT
jgi:hypothetical protein